MRTIQTLLMWGALAGLSVLLPVLVVLWCKERQLFPGRRLLVAYRRLPWFGQFLILAFAAHLIVFGSTKTNATDGVSGEASAGQRLGVRSRRELPVPTVSVDDIARGYRLAEVTTNASISYEMPDDAILCGNWHLRGAYDDVTRIDLGDWRFPLGSNSCDHFWAFVSAALRPTIRDGQHALAATDEMLSAIPRQSALWLSADSPTVRRITWEDFALGRVPISTTDDETNIMELVSAQIELHRNGDFIIRANDVEKTYRRVNPFDWDGDGLPNDRDPNPYVYDGDHFGQGEGWVRTHFDDPTDILALGYANWIDAQVGCGETNGLYKFTASFPVAPPESTLLRVGEESVVVTNAGEYVFLLEKGREYEFETVPYDPTVEYDMCDDIAPLSRMRLMGWWGEEVGIWTTDDGDRWLYPPSQLGYGTCFWEPMFRGAPDVANLTMADFPMTFTALFFDVANTNSVSYHWMSEDENVYIASPYAQTTEVEIDTAFDSSTFSLTVEAIRDDRTYRSTLMAGCPTNVESGVSFSFPETMFVNNDDDNNDGVIDSDQRVVPSLASGSDDDLAVAEIGLPDGAAREGTLRLEGKDGFYGMIYDVTERNASVGVSEEWEFSEGPAMSLPLEVSGWSVSDGYRTSELRFVWTPENGIEQTLIRRFTVVEPVVEPICSERKTVIRNGEEHKIVYNPCGVGIGRDAYFKISLKPESYPGAKIVWSANGEGSVSFVGGNTGREVCVRGVSAGDVTLEIDIGGCSAAKPTFPLKVVENVSIPIAVCILSNNGTLMREVSDVYAMLPKVNDIYEQVGMSFYIESVVVTNLPFACSPVYEGASRPRNWSFDKVANLLPDGNGLKCYFISEFVDAVKTVAANDENGMLLSRQADAQVWAHEIGHACNLRDIYYDENGFSISSEESFEWRHAPQDWNNGSYGENTKGSRYYRKNLTHKEAILTLLMYGYKTKTALDITSGKVEGVINISEDVSTIGDARTGVFASEATRSPRHIRKGEEK